MGLFKSKVLNSYQESKVNYRILIIGLDAAGKTTLLYQLKYGKFMPTIPTIGFNMETIDYKNLRLTFIDMDVHLKLEDLWRRYYENSAAVIFVVDSSREDRFEHAGRELHKIMSHSEVKDSVLLLLANKQDLEEAQSLKTVAESLRLYEVSQMWHVEGTSTMTGDGLIKSLEKLEAMLKMKRVKT